MNHCSDARRHIAPPRVADAALARSAFTAHQPLRPRAAQRILAWRLPPGFGIWILAALILGAIGCDPPPRPPLQQGDRERSRTRGSDETEPAAPISSGLPTSGVLRMAEEAPFDTWDAYFLNGEQVGYSHVRAEPTDTPSEIRYRVTERLRVLRQDTEFEQQLEQTSFETLSGQLKSFEAELRVNGERTQTRGQVVGNELVITTERNGETTERRIPWKRSYGGLLALQQSLKESPLAAGERRKITALAPMFYEIGELDIRGVGPASVPLLNGESVVLQEAESTSSIEGNPLLKMHIWVDDRGEILKSYAPNLRLSIFRTDEETAKQFAPPEIDLLASSQIELDKPIERPRQLERTFFKVRAEDPQIAETLFKDAPGQRVRKGEDGQWQVLVRQGLDTTLGELVPGDGDRKPGPLVQSNDERIKELASFSKATDQAELAGQLARVVYSTISEKNLGSGFASAAEVARTQEGDCTEHAVLLAAMCRARGIPARVAAGLLYVDTPSGPAMRYHMWTIAYVNGGWLALDGTMEDGVAAADRITLVTDDLARGTEYGMLAPVMQAFGQLSIVVETARHVPPPQAPAG